MSPPVERAEQSFPKTARLRTRAEFDRVYARRCKAGDGTLLMFGVTNASGVPRLGLSVSRKVGNAVVRNRLKRLLREAFRLSRSELPPLDLVVIPTSVERAGFEAYRTSLVRLARKVERRVREADEGTATCGG